MAQKSNKVKTPKVKGGNKASNRGRDEATGLYMDVDGTRFQGDITYNLLNSAQASALRNRFGENYVADDGRFASGGSYKGEFEFSKDAIINTNHYIYTKEGMESFQRITYLGSFEYSSSGALSKGLINEVSEWTYGRSLTDRQMELEWGSVDKTQMPIGKDIWDFQGNINNFSRVYDHNSLVQKDGGPSDPRERFNSYTSSKYHERNWWENPFATNLI